MTNSKVLFRELITAVSINEPKDEIESIVYLFMEKVLGVTKNDVITEHPIQLNESHKNQIEEFTNRINKHEPIQHILGESEFFGRTFRVNRNVLIPRPETEELVKEVVKFSVQQKGLRRILDIGTGSGCIAITLKLEIPKAEVFATDLSEEALVIARQNAQQLKADVKFYNHDILTEEIPVNELNIIVSNPPYVTISEKERMNENVLNFEPHQALFVPNDDPLLFYKNIVNKSKKVMKPGGLLIVEINEHYGKEVSSLFAEHSLAAVEIIKDIFGKDRIVKGIVL